MKGQTPLFSKAAVKRIAVKNRLDDRRARRQLTIAQKRQLGYKVD